MLDSFYKLVLNILITMSEDQLMIDNAPNKYGMADNRNTVKRVELNYEVIIKALVSHLEPREQKIPSVDQIIMRATQAHAEVY
jgi:hypothetical protein